MKSHLSNNYKNQIIALKQEIHQQFGDIEPFFDQVCDYIQQEIATIKNEEKNSGSAWPVIKWQGIADQKIS